MKIRKENEYDNFDILTDFENLYQAHIKCRGGKRWKDSVASYDIRALESTLYLQYLLKTTKYRMSKYHCFTINERGKTRDIKSIQYKDRVVQKSLCDNIIRPRIEPTFIYDNGASVKGKGTDKALDRLTEHMRHYFRKNGADGWVLIADMKSYFDSIPHDLLNSLYEKEFSDKYIVGLIHHIHASIPGGVGVPLGNELSQIDALIAFSSIDHYIKEVLRIKGYGRYMDDFYLIHEDKEYLKYCQEEIEQMAAELGLQLNTKKTKIVPMATGFNFLGFYFYMTQSGKVICRIKAKSKSRERQKLRKYKKKVAAKEMTMKDVRFAYKSWKAHASRGNTYYLLEEMDCYFYSLFFDYLTEDEKLRYEKLKINQSKRLEKRKEKRHKKN